MTPGPRRRVLVLAESAHPVSQSVSWVGWSHARALAAHNDVHLVTRSANREAILAEGLVEGRDFSVVDLERLEQRVLAAASWLRGGPEKGWTTLMALSLPLYLAFEREVWRMFGEAVRERRFDVVHRITPVSPTMPSPMAERCAEAGVPFVLGPLNGGLPWPRPFRGLRHAEREWLSYLRGAYRLAPFYRATRRAAAAILVGSLDTFRHVPAAHAGKCIYLPENGIDPARFPRPGSDARRAEAGAGPVRALFVGRLVPYKGCDMALEALASALREDRATLAVVGDGPQRSALEALADRLRVRAATVFTGRVPPEQMAQYYAAAELLVFPSVREFGGGVVLEAMAMGVVPVVAAYGGPGELVGADSGVRVPLAARPEFVAGIRTAVDGLLADPHRRVALAAAARRRVESLFTWPRKAAQMVEVYDWVQGRRPTKPCFHFLDGAADLPG
jgi:glycosyltransferase involved in cell wall biosynthesis